MAISFDPLNDTVGKDLSTLILQRRNQGSVGLSDLSSVAMHPLVLELEAGFWISS